MSQAPKLLLVFSEEDTLHLLEKNILSDYQTTKACSYEAAIQALETIKPDLLILGKLPETNCLLLANDLLKRQPTLPIVLLHKDDGTISVQDAIQLGLAAWLQPPLKRETVRQAVKDGLQRRQEWEKWLRTESSHISGPLLQRVSELETIFKVGRAITAELDLDSVLTQVVDAAVQITGAEEGNLLLLDEESGELYMRAARNFQDEFVRTFRIPVSDTYAGQVIQSGQPLFIDTEDPQKIKTAYLVYSLVYVPLNYHGRTIGVLGVDNRESGKSFNEQHITLLSTMADYAAIAIENATLYSQSEQARSKLETILTQIQDGVIVLDSDSRLVMVNHVVRTAFGLEGQKVEGLHYEEVFTQRDLLRVLRGEMLNPERMEIKVTDGHYFRAQTIAIPNVGTVVTLNDITYLKEMDLLKTEFVNTVSHDLRTPLTSIMGFVELIQRAGKINEQQLEYIERVQGSVHHITNLISEVLKLGKIEIGMDAAFIDLSLTPIIQEAVQTHNPKLTELGQNLELRLSPDLPQVYGDALQLRQMFENLLGNAIKYSDAGSTIHLSGEVEQGQIILRVSDTGRGIPQDEQEKIFERFYRASNVGQETKGTGLGLAIVRSIVENHSGRIWVDSKVGEGSTFTVMLPISQNR